MKFLICLLAVAAAAEPAFDGKSGRGLRDAVAAECAPRLTVEPRFEVFAGLDGQTTRAYDPWNDRWIGQTDYRDWHIPLGWMPVAWWERPTPQASNDLHNLRPCHVKTADALQGLPPGAGPLERVDYDNGTVQAGILGGKARCVPPAAYRGDLARAYMYMATLYPTDYIVPQAWTMLTGKVHPSLTPYALELLMRWHADDPVSPEEAARNQRVAELQGNANPFIDFPDLPRYLWGDKAGEPFVINPRRVPLHSTYHMADGRVDLYTPAAPADARWTVDGASVNGPSVETSALGTGRHHLTFTHGQLTGRVMITILP